MAANQNVTQLTQQTVSADTTSLFYAVTSGTTDTGLPLSVFVHNLGLTGTPTVPTATVGTNTTQIASTAYVMAAGFAPLASPTFTGVPAGPTATSGTNTTQFATTAYVLTSYATPPAIGNTTPAAGSFTTLSSSGLANLSSVQSASATFTGGTINSMSVGATTASTGKFTTIAASSTITPNTTAGIVGTTAADSANAGSIGEYITAQASGVSLTSGSNANITSISLTAGDWDVWGVIRFSQAATTTATALIAGTSTTSVTFGTFDTYSALTAALPANAGNNLVAPPTRINISTTTTVYLVGQATFATSTCTANGIINARRRR